MKKVKKVKRIHALIPFAIILFAICITQFLQSQRRGLIVGTSPVVPPFTYIGGENGSELMGFDIKLIEEIAKDRRQKYNVKVMSYDELLWAVESGEIDMIVSALSVTEYRKQYIDYSELYYQMPQVVVVRANDRSTRAIRTKRELAENKKIGTLRASAGISVIESISDGNISQEDVFVCDTWEQTIESLLNYDIDAIIMDIGSAKDLVLEYNNIVISNVELRLENYAVGVKKGNDRLLKSVNKTINRLIDSGKYRDLVIEHVNSYLAYEDD